MMRSEYDVVVVGSGYGGGVAASRMARSGKSVAVLELGKERWPGEYPSKTIEATKEIHVSGNAGKDMGKLKDIAAGKPTGLYHLVLGEGQNAFVANGLGGTSLLNANVFLECDKRTQALSAWPSEIRDDPASLKPYYSRAAEMLQPAPYPEHYPPLKKLSVLEKQAAALGQKQNFYRVPQTTFFHNGLNNAGVEMKASTGSGQDCTGVNDGSKSSILMNYLPDAWNWGAEIFCECEVRYVHRDPRGGYIVFYAWHGDERDDFEDDFYNVLMWVRAKELCFLGAGTLGTTEILLRSQAHGLKVSPLVGQKMSGNGDILSWGYNTNEIVNGIGRENPPIDNPTGPTITGVIDNRGPETSPNVLDGHVIEEGAIPEALAPVFGAMLEALPGKQAPEQLSATDRLRHLFSRTQTKIQGPYATGSSVNRTQTYLIMSHDSNEAILSLQNDKTYLQFLGVGRTEHVKKLNEVLAEATKAIGGTLVNSPFFAAFNQQEEITVHPLGGAIMSSDGTGRRGATNHMGQLFTGKGTEVYGGLICVDGSVIPTALGVNPFATITALAERAVHFAAHQRGWETDLETKNGRLDLFGKPAKSFALTPDMVEAQEAIKASASTSGVRFTEIMEGHIHIGDNIDDFEVAENVAKGASSAAKFYLSIDAYSVKNLIERSDHASLATGTFSCGALSKDPLLVLRGEVQFFSTDEAISDGTNLAYKLTLLSTAGETYLLNGYKKIDSNMAFSVSSTWKATTTLYTTLTHLDGSLVGKGMLYITWRNFVSELETFGSTGRISVNSALSIAGFLGYFAKNTADYFLGPLRQLEYGQTTYTGYMAKSPPVKTVNLTSSDGQQVTIRVWAPKEADVASSTVPLLMIPGASVDHQIFALPTIPINAVEYFTGLGYTVYIPTPRFGMGASAERGDTVYDARLDIRAAMEYVRKQHGSQKMHIICHCAGAAATSIGLLDGTLPTKWIQGVTVSQVFFKQKFGTVNAIKGGSPLLANTYQLLAGDWIPPTSGPSSPGIQRLLDQVLRFYPVGSKTEMCNSVVCHRSELSFGRLWSHANLNHSTHSQLANFIGGAHTKLLKHLMLMGTQGTVLDNEGHDLVTDTNLERLRGLPIMLFSGKDNVVYDPQSTSMTYDVLREKFGPELYDRRVVEGYGHLDCWMGKAAYRDVYPLVSDHVELCAKLAMGG